MAFDGTEGFIGMDEDAAAANECEDTFLDNAIRSNAMALRLLGHQVTWVPRTYGSSNMSQKEGIRPYASLAKSSILSIPWIAQEGLEIVHIAIYCRVADEHGQNLSALGNFTLSGIGSERFTFTNSDGSTPEYKAEQVTLELSEPVASERFIDLRIEQYAGAIDNHVIDSSLNAHAVLRQGAYVKGNSADDIMQQAAAAPPDSGDRHMMVWYNKDENAVGDDGGQAFDFLWAAPVDDFAYMRPINANPYIASQDCELRPLPYVQVRAVEVHEVWSPDFDMRPQGRYAPDRVVDGRDAIEHAIVQNRIHRRKRCLWIGPTGSEGDPEIWPGGYGPKFARVTGNSAVAQRLLLASIQPRTLNPRILVLLNLLPTWNTPIGSVTAVSTYTLAALEKAIEQAEWTFDVAIKRYVNGSATPATIASMSEVRELEHYPQLLTPLSAALQTEDVISTQNIGGALKEGQLFEEDHSLIQRVALELELTGYNPSINDMPCFIEVSLTSEELTKGLRYADVVDDVGFLDEGDLVVTCTGATIWEVPQG